MPDNIVWWLIAAGAVIVALITGKHNAQRKGFTKLGRFIGSEKLLPDYDAENDFIDKYSR